MYIIIYIYILYMYDEFGTEVVVAFCRGRRTISSLRIRISWDYRWRTARNWNIHWNMNSEWETSQIDYYNLVKVVWNIFFFHINWEFHHPN